MIVTDEEERLLLGDYLNNKLIKLGIKIYGCWSPAYKWDGWEGINVGVTCNLKKNHPCPS
jgi:hypothetical protein